MENWAVDLAGELKKRDNVRPIGAVLGKVVAVGANWKVTIKGGIFTIDKTNGKICNQILERKTTYDFKHSASGSISVSCSGGSGGSHSLNQGGSGNVHLHEVWKVGDEVLVVPDEIGQFFFIVDIVR